ncbi:unnamed protein product [Ambrosiozyma monospora]|uniref:Unnamed protein product n=1 Tax=Ambrosiozyma monospora TaxID=43982 RepID=A0ACB5TNA6_AMBMO|nr:unnamed protein product [Ambrosiozyma monospora]
MDIGSHCIVCRKLDFLPFKCPKCNVSYCSDHRLDFNEHVCKVDDIKKTNTTSQGQLPTAASVFPNLGEIRKQAQLEHSMKNATLFDSNNKSGGHKLGTSSGVGTKATSIASKLIANASIDESANQALQKLKKFLTVSKKKTSSSSSSSKFKLSFGSSSSSSGSIGKKPKKKSPAQKMIEISKLKQQAKGSVKISQSERVYIYCQYIPSDIAKWTNKSGKFAEPKPLFVSKAWPVGRLLDNVCELMKIKNNNDKSSTTRDKKLYIFRNLRDDEIEKAGDDVEMFKFIPYSGRVVKEIQDGDYVYVVRGATNVSL